MNPKRALLHRLLARHPSLAVAFSGGVDSAFLLAEAVAVLRADRVLAVIADSPSLPREALRDARALAAQIGAPLEILATREMEDPRYVSNPPDRCYFCKAELFLRMETLAKERAFPALAYGENADDAAMVRPGRRAAEEFRVVAPLKEAGLTKAEIREFSRASGLPTADAPAQPCLSSRIPHGTPVTEQALAMIEHAEAFLRALGFSVLRVRHVVDGNGLPPERLPAPGLTARVLVGPGEIPRLQSRAREIEDRLLEIGYDRVFLDPAGYGGIAPPLRSI